jgi:group I intron endonuclease
MAKIYRIYKCVNLTNGKVYIGYTNKPLEKRIIEHKTSAKNGSNYLFHKAIRKYGFEVFNWQIIFESLDKNFILNKMEKFFIKENNSYYENGFGYNMTFGGQGGMSNKTHSEESKEKMRLAWQKRENRVANPFGFSKESILKSVEKRKGKPSWNSGKKCPKISENNGAKKYKGKTWIKDVETGKRVWVV